MNQNTLLIGLYQGEKAYAIKAKYHRGADYVDLDILAGLGSDGWHTLASALQDLALIKAWCILVLTNDEQIARSLRKPFKAPKPDQQAKALNFQDRKYLTVGYGGNPAHWAVLQALTKYCATDGFTVDLVKVEILARTRELYEYYHPSANYGSVQQRQDTVRTGIQRATSTTERWFIPFDLLDQPC